MTLPNEVWEDLLTLYAAGEASPATREMVEEEMRRNPALAARLKEVGPVVEEDKPAPDVCLRSLRAIKRYHLLRLGLMGFGIPTLLVPLHPYFWHNKPFVIAAEFASGAAWLGFAYLSWRIQRAGLR